MADLEHPVVANVILCPGSGKSVVAARRTLTHKNVHEYLPSSEALKTARRELSNLGFHIGPGAETHISISGTQKQFEEVFQIRLTKRQEERAKPPYYVSTTEKPQKIPNHLSGVIETISFPRPIRYHTLPMPPLLSYYHLRVPDDIARDLDALRAHASGYTGAGVKLAIVDSGFMIPLHPYYVPRGYKIQPTVSDPRDPEPKEDDPGGHGTAMTACALAVAPGATLTVYKVYLHCYADAFAMAVEGDPHIISCSWETDFDEALHLAINHAVSKGILVVFSCGNAVGNEGPVGWPGCEPAVISVGGVYIRPDGGIEASNYASSGIDSLNEPGRQVPDFCGIVGQKPYGRLIALPTPPGFDADVKGSTVGHDETAKDDGWVVESGTSAAAAMVAGVAALVMGADSSTVRDPAAIKARLGAFCLEVTEGMSASNEPAGPATGAGLVQAYPAITRGGIRPEQHTAERGRTKVDKQTCCAGNGGEIRAYLLMRADDPLAAAVTLHRLVLQRQWNVEWSIKRVDTVDHDASSKLPKCAAPPDSHNLLVAVRAANASALENAFHRIVGVVNPSTTPAPHGHVLTSSDYLDWS